MMFMTDVCIIEKDIIMTVLSIIEAVKSGKTVCWDNPDYNVVFQSGRNNLNNPDDPLSYDIKCLTNKHGIGLTWMDGTTLNGKPDDFFIGLSSSDKYALNNNEGKQ